MKKNQKKENKPLIKTNRNNTLYNSKSCIDHSKETKYTIYILKMEMLLSFIFRC